MASNGIQNATPKTKNGGMNSGVPEGLAIPAPHVTSVVLLLNDTNIIWESIWTPVYVNKYEQNYAWCTLN